MISCVNPFNNVYNAFTEGRARLFGYAINRKMEIIQDGTVAYMSLLESEMRRFQFQQGDSEALPHPRYPEGHAHLSGGRQQDQARAVFADLHLRTDPTINGI